MRMSGTGRGRMENEAYKGSAIEPRRQDGLGTAAKVSVAISLAIVLGIAMPLITAVLYPTYFTQMAQPWREITRILEVPYVLFEIVFILWAGRRGFDLTAALKMLPLDIMLAGGVLVGAMGISSIAMSSDIPFALTHSLMWLVHLCFALAVYSVLTGEHPVDGDRFLAFHTVGLILLAIYTAWWFLTVPQPSTLPFGEVRLRGALPGWIDVRHFGSWTGAIAAGFSVRILWGQEGRGMTLAHLGYTIAAGLTVWSGTRAAILAIIAVCLIFLIMRRFPELQRIGWAALLTALSCFGAYLFLPDDPNFWLIDLAELSTVGNATDTRGDIWWFSIRIWERSPWFGLGTGSIFWEFPTADTPTQPHNVILQFLISWGIVGASSGLWLLGRGIAAVHRAGRGDIALIALLGMLYALLFQSLLEGMLHYPRFIVSIMVLGAIVLASRKLPAQGR